MYILQMAVANLIKFAVWLTLPCGHAAIMQKWYALEKGLWSYAHVKKAVFFLPVNILTVCGVLAF